MKRFVPCILILLIIFSCVDEETNPEVTKEEFFVEITIENSTYRISSLEYKMENTDYRRACADAGYVYGYNQIRLTNPREGEFIKSLNFSFSKKVFRDELNFTEDLSYTSNLITSKTFGFPVNPNGFYTVFDLESGNFEVSRNADAEVYLWLDTTEDVYRSTSTIPQVREALSFFSVTKIIATEGEIAYEYPYILEGTFKVNLFKGHYGTSSEQVDGKFRWPVSLVRTSELVDLCQ